MFTCICNWSGLGPRNRDWEAYSPSEHAIHPMHSISHNPRTPIWSKFCAMLTDQKIGLAYLISSKKIGYLPERMRLSPAFPCHSCPWLWRIDSSSQSLDIPLRPLSLVEGGVLLFALPALPDCRRSNIHLRSVDHLYTYWNHDLQFRSAIAPTMGVGLRKVWVEIDQRADFRTLQIARVESRVWCIVASEPGNCANQSI